MVKIRKRNPAPLTKDVPSSYGRMAHYTIYRHPENDPENHGYSRGPVDGQLLEVAKGVVSLNQTNTAQALYDKLAEARDWYIIKVPGRYSVVCFEFGMSFTFLVTHDKQYQPGWGGWPLFLRELWERRSNVRK